MGTPVAEYRSKSKPGRVYTVQIGSDGVTYCDCWQWKINKTCKHTKDYLANHASSQTAAFNSEQYNKPDRKPDIDPIQEAINEAVAMMKGNQ